MKISSDNSKNIIIELSPSDLEGLDITFDDMDYSNIETRRVIWTLLDMARIELGRDIDPSGRMLIEATPSIKGGCVLNFTVLSGDSDIMPKRLLVKKNLKEKIINVWEFENLENAARAAAALTQTGNSCPESVLYSMNGKYRLFLTSGEYPKGILYEFAKRIKGESVIASTQEAWKCLCERNCLLKLSRLA